MQFLRGYLSSVEKQWKLSWKNLTIWILLALFYASIPGITRVTVGDPSDGLKRKKFITFKEIYVEVGALVVNAFLMAALMFIVEVQYSKHMEHYREWMYELTMFLMRKGSFAKSKFEHLMGDDLDDEFAMSPTSVSGNDNGKYFPKDLYLSLKRRSNALGWLEIRAFLACQGKLFFGEQGI